MQAVTYRFFGWRSYTWVRGWLIVFIAGILASTVLDFSNVLSLIEIISRAHRFSMSDLHNELNQLLYFELAGRIALIVLALHVMRLFFTRRKLFIKRFALLVLGSCIVGFGLFTLITVASDLDFDSLNRLTYNIYTPLIFCIVGLPYCITSERVRQTFIL